MSTQECKPTNTIETVNRDSTGADDEHEAMVECTKGIAVARQFQSRPGPWDRKWKKSILTDTLFCQVLGIGRMV